MTRRTNARLAGFFFLFYIATGLSAMVLMGRATSGQGIPAKLASIAQHASDVRLAVLLMLLGCFSALVLAVTLYALTRDEDPELAMLALTCRVGEGVIGAAGLPKALGLLSVAAAGAGASAADASVANLLGAFLLMPDSVSAIFFAVGSTLFSCLFLRARSIPVPLAWLGVVASLLLVATLPLQLGGVLKGPLTSYIWMPMLGFELVLALWLLVKGVAAAGTR